MGQDRRWQYRDESRWEIVESASGEKLGICASPLDTQAIVDRHNADIDAIEAKIVKLRAVVVAMGPNGGLYDPGATAHNYSMSAHYAGLDGNPGQSEYLMGISNAVLALTEEAQ